MDAILHGSNGPFPPPAPPHSRSQHGYLAASTSLKEARGSAAPGHHGPDPPALLFLTWGPNSLELQAECGACCPISTTYLPTISPMHTAPGQLQTNTYKIPPMGPSTTHHKSICPRLVLCTQHPANSKPVHTRFPSRDQVQPTTNLFAHD